MSHLSFREVFCLPLMGLRTPVLETLALDQFWFVDHNLCLYSRHLTSLLWDLLRSSVFYHSRMSFESALGCRIRFFVIFLRTAKSFPKDNDFASPNLRDNISVKSKLVYTSLFNVISRNLSSLYTPRTKRNRVVINTSRRMKKINSDTRTKHHLTKIDCHEMFFFLRFISISVSGRVHSFLPIYGKLIYPDRQKKQPNVR